MRVYQSHVKVAETPQVKPGTILIAQGFWNRSELQRSVVLILEHDEYGSTGVILNKLTDLNVARVLSGFNINAPLFYGGPASSDRMGFLHREKNISLTVKITDDLYWGGNIYQLKYLMEAGELKPSEIKFYAGLVNWAPGELFYEICTRNWWLGEITFKELMSIDSFNLWTSKLIKQENLYGLLHAVPDPVLN
ncbi:MAG: YqgE/AlgH family protein [Bacteroidota bacterium]